MSKTVWIEHRKGIEKIDNRSVLIFSNVPLVGCQELRVISNEAHLPQSYTKERKKRVQLDVSFSTISQRNRQHRNFSFSFSMVQFSIPKA